MQMIYGVAALHISNYFYHHHPAASIYGYELKQIAQKKWMARAAAVLITHSSISLCPSAHGVFLRGLHGDEEPCQATPLLQLGFSSLHHSEASKGNYLVHRELRNALPALTGFISRRLERNAVHLTWLHISREDA